MVFRVDWRHALPISIFAPLHPPIRRYRAYTDCRKTGPCTDRHQGARVEAPPDLAGLHLESGRSDARGELQFQAHSSANELRGADGPSVANPRRLSFRLLRPAADRGEAGNDGQEGRDGVR